MSDAFSGQTTRSGRGRAPAATSAAASSVAVTWLSRTWRRSALKSRPGRGTLPWTAMTLPGAPSVGSGTANPVTRTTTAPARARSPERGRRSPEAAPTRRDTTANTPAASRPPASATANVTAGAPARAARCPNGESAWLNASRTHGKPPYGNRSRSASCTTQARATTSGRTRGPLPRTRPCRNAVAPPRRARNSPCETARASQGTTPTTVPAQLSEYPKKTRPVTSPSRKPVRARAPQVESARRATPATAKGQMSYPGNAAQRATPASSARPRRAGPTRASDRSGTRPTVTAADRSRTRARAACSDRDGRQRRAFVRSQRPTDEAA